MQSCARDGQTGHPLPPTGSASSSSCAGLSVPHVHEGGLSPFSSEGLSVRWKWYDAPWPARLKLLKTERFPLHAHHFWSFVSCPDLNGQVPSSLPTPSADVRWDHFKCDGNEPRTRALVSISGPKCPQPSLQDSHSAVGTRRPLKCQRVWSASARKYTSCQQDNWCLADGKGCWIINEGDHHHHAGCYYHAPSHSSTPLASQVAQW